MLDDSNNIRTIFALDRTNQRFSYSDYETVQLAIPQLNNLHKHYYAKRENPIKLDPSLTNREKEVLSLITLGDSPEKITDNLHISVATVRKHIANIYQKMSVDSMQELLVKVYN